MAPQIVFFHVGPDIGLPELFVRSVRATNPGAVVIQCSDEASPRVPGVTEIHRSAGDDRRLNLFRILAWAELEITGATMFCDTDMICLKRIDPAEELGHADVALCRRFFGREYTVSDGDPVSAVLPHHAGRLLGDAQPYLATVSIARDASFWCACRDRMATMPPALQHWYGDQEAIRDVAGSGSFKIRDLDERIYARLPEVRGEPDPKLLHFKGPKRKRAMIEFAKFSGLISKAPEVRPS